ncbi:MAG TPA: dodecin family protein [Nitriliruptoraceae bacterium]|nr:dodecin family protein [Nitriliruptoraceae bacterium]
MSTSIARVVEISANSSESFEDAVNAGMERARATLRNVSAGWVKDQRVRVTGDALTYQVNLEVTFVLDGDEPIS